jgi:hypothetical protein
MTMLVLLLFVVAVEDVYIKIYHRGRDEKERRNGRQQTNMKMVRPTSFIHDPQDMHDKI